MRRAIILVIGMLMAAAGNGLFAQTKPAPAAKPAAKPATKPAAAKPAAKSAPKAQKTSVKKAAAAPVEGAAPAEEKVSRRDPFESLVGRDKAAADAAKNLPPGKAGLQVSSLRLDGIVRAPNGMIAVVTNPQARTYFLREGDQLYDGRVEKIAMDSVSFHEMGKDAFGKPVERQVNKRIYSSAGEQQ
jgi:type IV pilus assembly protein PilP